MSKLTFVKVVQEGTHYEVGRQRGEHIARIPGVKEFYTSLPKDMPKLPEEAIAHRLEIIEKWCPGMKEELKGMADALDVEVKCLIHPMFGYNEVRRSCSQVAVMPERSLNGHMLLARSYEYSTEDEMIFGVTRISGKYAHMGFSLFQVGRYDGINEKGLTVTMSSCEVVHSSAGEGEGVAFWIAIRSVLDSCADTKEALKLLQAMPIGNNVSIMVADSSGDCAVVEILNDKGECSKIIRRGDGYIYALNHYLSKEHKAKYPRKRYFSEAREIFLDNFFASHEKVSDQDLKTLLSEKVPDGLCCHAYSGWFGTLWSMQFDVTEARLKVCFGSPKTGTWFEADLQAEPGIEVVEVTYEDEQVPDSFWAEH